MLVLKLRRLNKAVAPISQRFGLPAVASMQGRLALVQTRLEPFAAGGLRLSPVEIS